MEPPLAPRCCAFALCLAFFAGAPPLTAQEANGFPDPLDLVPRAANPADLAAAEALLEEALRNELTPDRSGWLTAASLHIRSAQLRPLGDEQVFRSLFRAAQILHVLDRDAAAQRTLEQSAAHARLYGHIEKEAEALLAAGWVANARADMIAFNRYLSRAYLLTYSPLLPEGIRDEVRRRVLLPAVTQAVALVAAR